ncbi:hypothetical protein JHK82_050005 [Glycine max]|nr:hypothetical protein JHK86_049882 [Glycine max]KAG5091227.1 hypothetical protein JHK82_050005 [Glycine max]
MNAKRREDMVGVLPKRRILMRHGESQGNWDTTAYTTTLPTIRVQFYVSPYAHTRSTLRELRRYFLKKRIIGVKEESRVQEQNFGNFQVE